MYKILSAIKFILVLTLLFFIFFIDVKGQSFRLKVSVSDHTAPLTGVSVLRNNKVIGNTNSLGEFEGGVSVGDILMMHPGNTKGQVLTIHYMTN
jgi:hypothetical protein